jgi:pantoate--beta-alanine ligase
VKVVSSRDELVAARGAVTSPVGVVMTMGALHEGHVALLRAARARSATVLVTVFVNPLQFGPNEDLDRYPRTLDRDLAVAEAEGADLVFTPGTDVMYPSGDPRVRVNPGPLGEVLEGASRPGFFHGVLTVVAKLLHLTRPDLAFFGEKDYQQLTLIRAMCADLDFPVQIVGVPTVREHDGLALSSRNRYLSPAERVAATALSRALRAGAEAAEAGLDAAAAATAVVAATPDVKLDYLVVTDPALGPAPTRGPARMLVAAWVGGTRLIDNAPLELGRR